MMSFLCVHIFYYIFYDTGESTEKARVQKSVEQLEERNGMQEGLNTVCVYKKHLDDFHHSTRIFGYPL